MTHVTMDITLEKYSEKFKIPNDGVSKDMQHLLKDMVEALDTQSKNNMKILEMLNRELKLRPTYNEAVSHFRLNIKPEECMVL